LIIKVRKKRKIRIKNLKNLFLIFDYPII